MPVVGNTTRRCRPVAAHVGPTVAAHAELDDPFGARGQPVAGTCGLIGSDRLRLECHALSRLAGKEAAR